MAVKNIIFDMGGVLVDFDPDRSLRSHFPEEVHGLIKKNTFLSDEWREMDRGTIEVEDAVKIMCARLPEELRAEASQMILDHDTEMPAIENMYPVVEALSKSGYKIYLLSNCPMWLYEFSKHISAFRFFDGFIVSAEYNQIKPDEDIYHTLFAKFNLVPSECFFIDDSIKNVETGLKLGMKAHCFADKDIDKLKAALKNEGVII